MGFTVTGPGLERNGYPSGGAALSVALTHALRPGPVASYYVRDGEGVCFGRAERLTDGRVEVWRLDRGSATASHRRGSSAGVPGDVPRGGVDMAQAATKKKNTRSRASGSSASPKARKPAAVAGGAAKAVSAKDAAVAVLKAAGGPLKAAEIAQGVLATKGVKLGGKTPEATVAAILAVENKKADGLFVRTAPATYALREKAEADAA